MVVPGLLKRVFLVIDGDHSSNLYFDLNDDPVTLKLIKGIAAGLLQVSAEVDTTAEHPPRGLFETGPLDGSGALPGGPMVHDVGLTIKRLSGSEPIGPRGRIEVVFSPPHVDVSRSAEIIGIIIIIMIIL